MTPFRLALAGAFRLVRGDASGLQAMSGTVEGFWHSFQALWLMAPIYLLQQILIYVFAPADESLSLPLSLLQTLELLAIGWCAYPVLLVELKGRIGRPDRQLLFLTAGNWLSVPQALITTAALVITFSGILGSFGAVIFLATMIGLLMQRYWLARLAYLLDPPHALSVVLLDLAVTLLIWILSDLF